MLLLFSTMGKKIWLSCMYLRNFRNHVTVRAPSAPQGEMTFFTLCGGNHLFFT